uniref:DDE-1 domain-containing protein n=1 Tax=Timema monikensis TaxID=170555 RepID=A0A7R9E3G2_9NEOP|nr:unnamed protein product [Timema monikensis]
MKKLSTTNGRARGETGDGRQSMERTRSAPICHCTSVLCAMKTTLAPSGWWTMQSLSSDAIFLVVAPGNMTPPHHPLHPTSPHSKHRLFGNFAAAGSTLLPLARYLLDRSLDALVVDVFLKDAIYMVADAWGSLTDDNLKNAWKKLWPIPETLNQGRDEIISQTPSDANTPTDAEVVALFQTLPGFEHCDELDAREWFESDGNDPGYQNLNDNEIVHQVIEDNDNGSNVREKSDDDEEMDAEEAAGPSHSDAYEAFQTAMNWLERQPEGTVTQLVLLKRLRDMAAK